MTWNQPGKGNMFYNRKEKKKQKQNMKKKSKVKFLKIENLKLAIGDEINDDVVFYILVAALAFLCYKI